MRRRGAPSAADWGRRSAIQPGGRRAGCCPRCPRRATGSGHFRGGGRGSQTGVGSLEPPSRACGGCFPSFHGLEQMVDLSSRRRSRRAPRGRVLPTTCRRSPPPATIRDGTQGPRGWALSRQGGRRSERIPPGDAELRPKRRIGVAQVAGDDGPPPAMGPDRAAPPQRRSGRPRPAVAEAGRSRSDLWACFVGSAAGRCRRRQRAVSAAANPARQRWGAANRQVYGPSAVPRGSRRMTARPSPRTR